MTVAVTLGHRELSLPALTLPMPRSHEILAVMTVGDLAVYDVLASALADAKSGKGIVAQAASWFKPASPAEARAHLRKLHVVPEHIIRNLVS
jgi:hypothetical protein